MKERPEWMERYIKQLQAMLGGREPSEATLDAVERCHFFLCRMSVTEIPLVHLAVLAAQYEAIAAPVPSAATAPPKVEKTPAKKPPKAGAAPPPTPHAESMKEAKPEIICPFIEGQKVITSSGGVPLGGVFKRIQPNNKALVRVGDRDLVVPMDSIQATNG